MGSAVSVILLLVALPFTFCFGLSINLIVRVRTSYCNRLFVEMYINLWKTYRKQYKTSNKTVRFYSYKPLPCWVILKIKSCFVSVRHFFNRQQGSSRGAAGE